MVTRKYEPSPEHCTRAVEILLKRPVGKAAGHDGGEDDAKPDKEDRASDSIP